MGGAQAPTDEGVGAWKWVIDVARWEGACGAAAGPAAPRRAAALAARRPGSEARPRPLRAAPAVACAPRRAAPAAAAALCER